MALQTKQTREKTPLFRVIRSYVRLLAVVSWALFMITVRVMSQATAPFSKRLDQWFRRVLFQYWAAWMLRITGVRVEVRGDPPQAPFFLACNHLSFIDVFVLTSRMGCVFISRDDVEHWPVFGFIVRNLNTIFVNRKRMRDTLRVNAEIRDRLDAGFGVVIFPEGGVSQDAQVHAFKAALLQPAASMNMPVHYASIHYSTPEGCPPASEVNVWKDGVSFARHFLNVAGLPHCKAIVTFGKEPIANTDRKVLADELCQAVREQFIPLD